ncbi:collagen alpha-1(I) chain-like [Hippopotamus amphibius kiboko]|uniref:collagen alpha-1(I) chain-like n=1 Tax=Hippopotamus amphibius kiboko TaxID=575201 RepID=UPI0025952123|nr:collagen alpha-1(I) chain-like [Hippopotamus amphibius kiboko]
MTLSPRGPDAAPRVATRRDGRETPAGSTTDTEEGPKPGAACTIQHTSTEPCLLQAVPQDAALEEQAECAPRRRCRSGRERTPAAGQQLCLSAPRCKPLNSLKMTVFKEAARTPEPVTQTDRKGIFRRLRFSRAHPANPTGPGNQRRPRPPAWTGRADGATSPEGPSQGPPRLRHGCGSPLTLQGPLLEGSRFSPVAPPAGSSPAQQSSAVGTETQEPQSQGHVAEKARRPGHHGAEHRRGCASSRPGLSGLPTAAAEAGADGGPLHPAIQGPSLQPHCSPQLGTQARVPWRPRHADTVLAVLLHTDLPQDLESASCRHLGISGPSSGAAETEAPRAECTRSTPSLSARGAEETQAPASISPHGLPAPPQARAGSRLPGEPVPLEKSLVQGQKEGAAPSGTMLTPAGTLPQEDGSSPAGPGPRDLGRRSQTAGRCRELSRGAETPQGFQLGQSRDRFPGFRGPFGQSEETGPHRPAAEVTSGGAGSPRPGGVRGEPWGARRGPFLQGPLVQRPRQHQPLQTPGLQLEPGSALQRAQAGRKAGLRDSPGWFSPPASVPPLLFLPRPLLASPRAPHAAHTCPSRLASEARPLQEPRPCLLFMSGDLDTNPPAQVQSFTPMMGSRPPRCSQQDRAAGQKPPGASVSGPQTYDSDPGIWTGPRALSVPSRLRDRSGWPKTMLGAVKADKTARDFEVKARFPDAPGSPTLRMGGPGPPALRVLPASSCLRPVGWSAWTGARSEVPPLTLRPKPHPGGASGPLRAACGQGRPQGLGRSGSTSFAAKTPRQPSGGSLGSSCGTRGSAGRSQTSLQPQEPGRGPPPRSHNPGFPSGSPASLQTSQRSKPDRQRQGQGLGGGQPRSRLWKGGLDAGLGGSGRFSPAPRVAHRGRDVRPGSAGGSSLGRAGRGGRGRRGPGAGPSEGAAAGERAPAPLRGPRAAPGPGPPCPARRPLLRLRRRVQTRAGRAEGLGPGFGGLQERRGPPRPLAPPACASEMRRAPQVPLPASLRARPEGPRGACPPGETRPHGARRLVSRVAWEGPRRPRLRAGDAGAGRPSHRGPSAAFRAAAGASPGRARASAPRGPAGRPAPAPAPRRPPAGGPAHGGPGPARPGGRRGRCGGGRGARSGERAGRPARPRVPRAGAPARAAPQRRVASRARPVAAPHARAAEAREPAAAGREDTPVGGGRHGTRPSPPAWEAAARQPCPGALGLFLRRRPNTGTTARGSPWAAGARVPCGDTEWQWEMPPEGDPCGEFWGPRCGLLSRRAAGPLDQPERLGLQHAGPSRLDGRLSICFTADMFSSETATGQEERGGPEPGPRSPPGLQAPHPVGSPDSECGAQLQRLYWSAWMGDVCPPHTLQQAGTQPGQQTFQTSPFLEGLELPRCP